MGKLILVFVALISSIVAAGCATQASAAPPKDQKIDIDYNLIVYAEP
jgi:hypothetical protein